MSILSKYMYHIFIYANTQYDCTKLKKNIKEKRDVFHYRKKYTCSDYNLSKRKGLVNYGRNFYVSIYDNYAIINLVCVLFVFVFVSKNTTKIEPINPKTPAKREFTKSQHKFYNTNGVYNTSLFVVKNCSL